MAVLCFLTKLKQGPGLASGVYFLLIFQKNVPYLRLYPWTNFKCHTFSPSQDIKQNLLSFYLDSW